MAQSDAEILDGIAEIVNDETGIDKADVQPDKRFIEDLDIDSLTMATVVVNAEDKFGVEIPDEDYNQLVTVQDVITYVQKKQDA